MKKNDKLNILFYPNHPDDMHCSQSVFRSLFEYLCNEKYSWEEIDKLTKTIQGKGSWTMAAYIELAKRGVEVINLEPFDYAQYYQEGVPYLERTFDHNTVQYYLTKSNLLTVRDDIPEFLRLVYHESRRASIEEIDQFLDNGYLIGTEINSRILNKKPGFSLHYVLIKGREGDNYIINDPGLPPLENRLVSKKEFMEALGGETANGEVTAVKKK